MDREALKKVFTELDTDASGSLNAAEIRVAFEKIGMKPTLVEIGAMIKKYDTNGVRWWFTYPN